VAINSNCCTALLQGEKTVQQKKNGHLPIFLYSQPDESTCTKKTLGMLRLAANYNKKTHLPQSSSLLNQPLREACCFYHACVQMCFLRTRAANHPGERRDPWNA
jgi:hypothetical protein